MEKKSNSMKRRSNGRYQMKRAMHKGRIKARAKARYRKQANSPLDYLLSLIFTSAFGIIIIGLLVYNFICNL